MQKYPPMNGSQRGSGLNDWQGSKSVTGIFFLVARLLNDFRCTVLWTLIPKFGAWFWERHLELIHCLFS